MKGRPDMQMRSHLRILANLFHPAARSDDQWANYHAGLTEQDRVLTAQGDLWEARQQAAQAETIPRAAMACV